MAIQINELTNKKRVVIDIDEFTEKQEYMFLRNTSTKERRKMIVTVLQNCRLGRAVSSVCSVDWRKLLICSVLGLSGQAAWAGLLDKVGQYLTDDYLWDFRTVYGPGVDLYDVRWRWGGYTLAMEDSAPTWSRINTALKPISWGGTSQVGPFPDSDLHVEWVSSAGNFYVVDIPLKNLLAKNKITYKMHPKIKLWFDSSEEVAVRVELGPLNRSEIVDIYSSKNGSIDSKQATVTVPWWTINFEIPPWFDTRTFNMRWNYFSEGPNEELSSRFLKKSGRINKSGHPIKSGRYRIFKTEKIDSSIELTWISPVSGIAIRKEIPVRAAITQAKIALPENSPNLFNYSHELLIRITSDDNVELVFGPKAEYVGIVKNTPLIIYSTVPAINTP